MFGLLEYPSEVHMQIKDEAMNFKAENFDEMHATFKQRGQGVASKPETGGRLGRGRGRFGRGGRGGRGGRSQQAGKQEQGEVAADITKILTMVKKRSLEPVIVFSFARR